MIRVKSLVTALLLAVLFVGCNKAPSSNELLVYVCDAPADYTEVTFTILSIEMRAQGTTQWVSMPVSTPNVSLLTLVAGRMQKICSAKLAPGKYDAMRISIDPTNPKVGVGADKHSMSVSLEPLEIKLSTAVTIDGQKQSLLLDFDAAASVIEKRVGETIEYSFVPLVRVIDPDAIGSVRGGVALKGGAAVGRSLLLTFTSTDASGAAPVIYSTYTEAKGAFFIRLAPGSYTMTITSSSAQPLEPWSQQVTVESAKVVNMGMVVVTAIPKQ